MGFCRGAGAWPHGGRTEQVMKIAFIGLGNMANAILKGILDAGIAKASDVTGVCNTSKTAIHMATEYGINASTEITDDVFECDIVFLAVKPQVIESVAEKLKGRLNPEQLIVSVIAGKSLTWLKEHLGEGLKIIRTMPNTPALAGEGCTGITSSDAVSDDELQKVVNIFGSFGKAYVVKESLMDTVGAVSGCSPAFVFMFMEALADGAVKYGMPRPMAYEFVTQTVLGSAKLMQETGNHPGVLKDMVCSPGGTTIEAVEALEKGGFRASVMEAVDAVMEKSRKL